MYIVSRIRMEMTDYQTGQKKMFILNTDKPLSKNPNGEQNVRALFWNGDLFSFCTNL